MKLTIYKTDGIYTPKGKANPSQRFDFIREKLAYGYEIFELYDGKDHSTIKCKDVNAIMLEFPNNKEVKHKLELRTEDFNKTVEYDNDYAYSSQKERIAKARDIGWSFVILDGHNCKLAVRTELIKGEY